MGWRILKLDKYILLENGTIQKTKSNEEHRGFKRKGNKLYLNYLKKYKDGYLYLESRVIATASSEEELRGLYG